MKIIEKKEEVIKSIGILTQGRVNSMYKFAIKKRNLKTALGRRFIAESIRVTPEVETVLDHNKKISSLKNVLFI